ncbi:FadR/GntR family transcriptional regulator [Cohnella lupini]|uniref:GntR family transcriptional repressor for pyruvate dehydrogenase complex n=1 Tax=Cohnella lupini TaxID=1294267 RepID=A0A3D9IQH0_9BACL|nr:FadR/GntR family transcriptional regulator [Cohnella lupini]RED63985.1 GntR family transcriptional repressor for pyruvate dehydrogenase complex [Cohnella lupini]
MQQTKIETPKGHELVGERIVRRIRDGEWQTGQRLPSVVQLAEAYGVGRSTIREAVSALKAMGWLDVRQGGGTFVKSVLPNNAKSASESLFQGADSLVELLEVRKSLEIGAASLAAERRSSADLARFRELLALMELSLDRDDTSEGERADTEFHMAIAAASGNSLFVQLMESIADRFAGSIRQTRELWFYQEKATASRLLNEHRTIYEAIEKQDKLKASELISDHLSKVERLLREALSNKSV